MLSEPIRLEARRVRFRWETTSPEFIPGDPFNSHFINVLHLLLPEGERWFCRLFREAEPLITDPKLLEAVKGFVRQEAMHASAHAVVLDHYAKRGIDTAPFTRKMELLFQSLLGDAPPGLERFASERPREWLVARVAIVAAIEQFTCMLGEWVLDSKALDEAGADPTMLDLLRWHGAEEVEHRSVAFDLFQHLSGSYAIRAASMALVLPVFLGVWFHGARYLLEADPDVPASMRRSELGLVPMFERSARTTRRVPSLVTFLTAAWRYVSPDYDPEDEGSIEAALAYLASSPAVSALRAN